jgi:hypothetical protein
MAEFAPLNTETVTRESADGAVEDGKTPLASESRAIEKAIDVGMVAMDGAPQGSPGA